MKELHLDIELAKSGIDLNNAFLNSSGDKVMGIESRLQLAKSYNECEIERIDSYKEQEGSYIDKAKENVYLSNLVNVYNVTMEVDHGSRDDTEVADNRNGDFSRYRGTGLGAKVNTGFVPDSKDIPLKINGGKGPGSRVVALERSTDQTLRATDSEIPIETLDDSKKTTNTLCSDTVLTAFLLWNATSLGWGYGQMGPMLPDLQDLADVTLQQGSWLFTGFAIGYLAGCLLAGFTQTRFNPNLMLFSYTLISACSFGLLPWIPIFPVMVFLRALSGIGLGGQDTGVLTLLFKIWGNKVGPFNQMIFVLFAVGGISSSLVTKPFLRKVSSIKHIEVSNSTDFTLPLNSTVTSSFVISTDEGIDFKVAGTKVHYALLISSLLFLSAAIPFLVAFVTEPQTKTARKNDGEKMSQAVENKLPKHIKRIVLINLSLIVFVATACTDLFPSYLTTFVMEQVGWSQQDGSTLTSLFFAMFAVGNFINIFVSVYVSTTKIFVISCVSSVIMLSCIVLSVVFVHTELLWVTVTLSGAAMSNLLPTLYTWTQQYVTPITAVVASGLLISGSLGISLNPLLVGYMMEVYSPMWFIYLSIGNIVFCTLSFLTAMVLTKMYSSNAIGDQNHNKNEYLQKSYEITHF